MKSVHAVTIHHRGRQMLAECLESLLQSEGVDLNVVVVANGCDEPMPELVETSSRVHLVELEQPCGFSEANNRGVAWAVENLGRSDHYYFINNDTVSESDALTSLVSRIEADPRVAVVGPRLLIQWAPEHLNSLGLNVTEDGWGWDEGIGIHQAEYGPMPGARPVLAVTGSALLMTASAFHEVGGWPEIYEYYFEDIDLCLRARSAGWEVVNDPEAVVYHQVSATMTLESERKVFLFWRNSLLLVLMHWPARLMLRTLRQRVWDQIVRRPWAESGLQRRSLGGAMAKLGQALWRRLRIKVRDRSWTRLLRPVGSTPVITLPERRDRVDGADELDGAVEQLSIPLRAWDPVSRLRSPHASAQDAGRRRVLVVGCAPLPFENERMHYAPSARTWQIARPLVEAGHDVCVLALRIPGACDPGLPPVVCLEPPESPDDGPVGGRAVVLSVDGRAGERLELLSPLVDRLDPDLVVGATARSSRVAARLAGDRPVWVDLFGDPMAEAQARAGVYPDQSVLVAYRDLMDELLERGDAFSVVSDRQRMAAIGQLGLAGRLNAANLEHELVHTVPCSVGSVTGLPADPRELAEDGSGDSLDERAFVLLWSGGFNTWCDINVLVDGVERAMASEPRLVMVVTGGAIEGHDERTHDRWIERIGRSAHRDRFLVKGCLPAIEAERYLSRADAGVVTERPIAERLLGSSARVCRWLGVGLPVICTRLSELGEAVELDGLGWTYAPGDADDLARAILEAVAADRRASRPEELMSAASRACKRWSDTATTAAVRRWVEQAGRAPDAGSPSVLASLHRVGELAEVVEENRRLQAERDRLLEEYHSVRSELGLIHQSRMWSLWMLWLGIRRALTWPLRRLRGVS